MATHIPGAIVAILTLSVVAHAIMAVFLNPGAAMLGM